MPKNPDIPDLGSAYALTRFFLRLAVFCVFAAISSQGFGQALESLMMLAIIYCIVAATFRHEEPLGTALTHFDEAAAYGVIAGFARLIS